METTNTTNPIPTRIVFGEDPVEGGEIITVHYGDDIETVAGDAGDAEALADRFGLVEGYDRPDYRHWVQS